MLVPLAVFFAVSGNKEAKYTAEQSRRINRWFWRSAFSRRYSSGVIRNLNFDIVEMKKLAAGEGSSLGDFVTPIYPDFFLNSTFNVGSVNTKTFILFLAQFGPLSFISGTPIDLANTLKEANRTEFHHLMPRDFVKQLKQVHPDTASLLANFCFLSRADNRMLGGDPPSVYRAKMAANIDEILGHALCPASLFEDDFVKFMNERSEVLMKAANKLCENPDKKIP
jgi:hypothetical protein